MKTYIVVVLSLFFFVACKLSEEDQQKMKRMQRDLPEQEADSVDVIYSERGEIKMMLEAPKLVMKDDRNETYNEFPEGLHMTFYNEGGEKNADLYANYGYDDQRARERYVKDCVRIITADGYHYTTSELYIDDKKDSVHNNGKYVKITRDDGTLLQGVGFTSDSRLEKIRINSIRNSQLPIEEEQQDSLAQNSPAE